MDIEHEHPLHRTGINLGDVKNYPVTISLAIFLFVITLAYEIDVLDNIPCEIGVLKGAHRTIVHANWKHLFVNIFTLLMLSRIEEKHGSAFFASLILQIWFISVIIEFVTQKYVKLRCSIGFSGVLLGLIAWEMVANGMNIVVLLSLAILVVIPSIQNKKASLSGHIIGAISGLIVAMYFKSKEEKKK